MCGAPAPPDPAGHYPRRTYPVRLEEVVGWTAERVLAELGEPNARGRGDAWGSPEPMGFPLVQAPGGNVIRTHVFGPVPRRIEPLRPYETWVYHNVEGSTWVLYLTGPWEEGVGEAEGATPPARPTVWARLARLFVGEPRRRAPAVLPLRGPLAVAEVTQYPTGAVF